MNNSSAFPSPLPPWHRQIKTPGIQTLAGDGAILLTMDTTWLDQTEPKDAGNLDSPYLLTLPNGNCERQTKVIAIKSQDVPDLTAKFRVTGTFVGFTSLLLDAIGQSAVLMWDGAGWHFMGGNAKQEL